MDRRAFVGSLAIGALSTPGVSFAQPARKVARIGILGLGATANLVGPQPRSSATSSLLRGLRELGYVYGQQFVTEPRGADARPERFPALVAELIRLRSDIIVAAGPALLALKQATATVPVSWPPLPIQWPRVSCRASDARAETSRA